MPLLRLLSLGKSSVLLGDVRTCVQGLLSSSPELPAQRERETQTGYLLDEGPLVPAFSLPGIFRTIGTICETLLSKRMRTPSAAPSWPWCCRGEVAMADVQTEAGEGALAPKIVGP